MLKPVGNGDENIRRWIKSIRARTRRDKRTKTIVTRLFKEHGIWVTVFTNIFINIYTQNLAMSHCIQYHNNKICPRKNQRLRSDEPHGIEQFIKDRQRTKAIYNKYKQSYINETSRQK